MNETTKPQDNIFGLCPYCLTGRFCSTEFAYWGYCETHRVAWLLGSSHGWRDESEDYLRATNELLNGFREITPHWVGDPADDAPEPCLCTRCVAPAFKAVAAEPGEGQRNLFDAEDD